MFFNIWLACSIINAAVITYFQYTHPVSRPAHIKSMVRNILLGPISTIGCVLFISYMMIKQRLTF